MKRKTHKRSKFRIFSNLFLIIAILLLNYPIVADIHSARQSERLYSDYATTVSHIENYDEIKEAVDKYNEALLNNPNRFTTEKTSDIYPSLLAIQYGSIMGYITMEKAGIVSVPVYHYTSAESLQVGAGHFAGSSLPSEKPGIHTVISGHSGMTGMKMFSQLSQVSVGDRFELKCLDKILVYEVDGMFTVLPGDTSELTLYSNENYCSLVTCVPLGLNTHRLIVRGVLRDVRDVTKDETKLNSSVTPSALLSRFAIYELVLSGVSIILIFIFIKDNIKYLKKKKKQKRRDTLDYPQEIPFEKL